MVLVDITCQILSRFRERERVHHPFEEAEQRLELIIAYGIEYKNSLAFRGSGAPFGLREYIVDVSNKQVVVKADFGFRWKLKNEFSKTEKRKYWHLLGVFKCLGLICFCKQIALAD
ncbi:hypothetical protein ES288_D12G258000v1 [Gossypium darwinii]|uniref:Uncharacterized protein isoform X1 n=2 Tax=Gossypium TaxID=3633 RepID=A0ABM3B8D0_GOSHI|nr:uncharacterized protein LOC121224318 isoform X1 [Gossypium hirsutum]TYG42454.1 hypothetical protein ES288_D12G258000v1 [Gossypium darwinii]